MKYDLIVSDYDHTLANESRTVSERNVNAIREFQNKGGRFMLCTGRMFGSGRTVAKKIGLKGDIIAYNGALIGDIESGEIFYHTRLDKDVAIGIIRQFEGDTDVTLRVYVDDVMYEQKENETIKRYAEICNVSYCVTGEPLSEYLSKKDCDVTNIRVIAKPEKVLEFYKKYRALNCPDYTVIVSEASFLEFISPEANKGIALKKYCEAKKINPKRVVAFGDNYNDIYMIEYAGLGVAVANGVDELLEKADYICPTNEADGVGETIERITRGEI